MEQQEIRPKRYLVADTETCGLGEHQKACELAIREIDPVTLDTIKEWESLIDPQWPIQPGASEIHGIYDKDVVDAPTLAEYLEHVLKDEFVGYDIVFIGHNAQFDLKCLHTLFDVTQTVCTLAWARRLLTDAPNNKLQTLREHFGYPAGEAHRALADVATTVRVLRELLQRSGFTLEQFAMNGQHTVHVMPWGAHRGKLLMQVPVPYLRWLWSVDLEENMRESVKKALTVHGVTIRKGVITN